MSLDEALARVLENRIEPAERAVDEFKRVMHYVSKIAEGGLGGGAGCPLRVCFTIRKTRMYIALFLLSNRCVPIITSFAVPVQTVGRLAEGPVFWGST